MDARPFRPRGTENVAPSLHQRHKSTGNLLGVEPVGLRGPAKRAAFGDVTNVSRATGVARDDAKNAKVLAPAAQHQTERAAINKENVPYGKDALARATQQAGVLAEKPKNIAQQPEYPNNKAVRPASQGVLAKANLKNGEARLQNAANERIAPLKQGRAFEAPPLQPRHHKSQPQLKPQRAPVDPEEIALQVAIESIYSRPASSGSEVAIGLSQHVVETADDHARPGGLPLPESGQPPSAEQDLQFASAMVNEDVPHLSEPEEYWDDYDEDEDDYDDQDQAYTTAHSYRTRDLTTGGATTILFPKVTNRVQRELEDARVEVENSRTQQDIDDELWDVGMCAEYADDICEYMRELEIRMLPNPHYMDSQTEIQWSMRSVLMDWLVQVHGRFGLLPETLFLTVNYIDRFLTSKIVSMGKLQLVGATALLIASKYEEINCPSLQDIVYMVDNSYTAEEILKAERYMLSMLNFQLGWPGPMSFLRRVSKADNYDLETRTLAKYFLELTIMDERFVASPPSYLAAGAHCLARLMLDYGSWSRAHVHWSGYTWGQLRPLVAMMLECCEEPRLHHAAIFEKYAEKRFRCASTMVQETLDAGFALPQYPAPMRALSAQVGHDHTSESLERSQLSFVPAEGCKLRVM